MESGSAKKQGEPTAKSLMDIVFSWSIGDILNKYLCHHQVEQIPEKFLSAEQYLNSFIPPLIEEIHADLSSSILSLSRSPSCEILSVEIVNDNGISKELLYNLSLSWSSSNANDSGAYEPSVGDLIVLTDTRPRSYKDLNRPGRFYALALVQVARNEVYDRIQVLSSKPIDVLKQDFGWDRKRKTLFALLGMNMITSIRIWKALNSEPNGESMSIIKNVLQADTSENCVLCNESCSAAVLNAKDAIKPFNLNDSQESAILRCIATRECHHRNSVKLIWGPPGTGKTKTVGSLLFVLLGMKCRTLTCAPTNIAVLEVASRLLGLFKESLEFDSYGLGDIVLFGNAERMKIDDYGNLHDVYLDHRARVLAKCLSPLARWKHNLDSMRRLLEDPEEQYSLYLKGKLRDDEDNDVDKKQEKEQTKGCLRNEKSKIFRENPIRDVKSFINKKKSLIDIMEELRIENLRKSRERIRQRLEESKNRKLMKEKAPSQEENSLEFAKGDTLILSLDNKNNREVGNKLGNVLTLEVFIKDRFNTNRERLKFSIKNLYTHLPTSSVSVEAAKSMMRAVGLLDSVGQLLHSGAVTSEELKKLAREYDENSSTEFIMARKECIHVLRSLHSTLSIPEFPDEDSIRDFCLQNACLLFCTASSSAKLHSEGMRPPELLVIDEAAQLKECESVIPLQLSGLRHAFLIGDEQQLPAMVKSNISDNAAFGRSLFERLVLLGHGKHLLNVQYRMHPSISFFPNGEFYNYQISDAPNVREGNYERRFLRGKMFGPYSFVDVTYAKEEFQNGYSTKNMVEVAVVAELVTRLFEESVATKQKFRVGIISPYNAQVFAIKQKLGERFSSDGDGDFIVNVRSIDGFQGGEEDLIIVSTVRCNVEGSVGFLYKHQRVNVTLTRAKHCLWIVGHGETLEKSNTVWKKIVVDAKDRGCFYSAEQDERLAQAMTTALIELDHLDVLFTMETLSFTDAKWKVCLSDEFRESMARTTVTETRKEVFSLLKKLSQGWREPRKERNVGSGHSEMLEVYKVKGQVSLVWSVDILEEDSYHFQALKVWDILPLFMIPKLAKDLDTLFENYSADTINRCKLKCAEGKYEVPIRWPVDSKDHADRSTSLQIDLVRSLSSPFASLSLRDESDTSSSNG